MSKASLTADAVVFAGNGEDLAVLLIRRGHEPFKDSWAFPGGFLEEGEAPLPACLRELREEAGLHLDDTKAIALSFRSQEGRDPRGPVATYPFMFHLEKVCPVSSGDDAKEAQWVRLTSIDVLAFDHGAILLEALGKFWSCMPSFDERLSHVTLPKLFLKNSSLKNAAIFYGGSFNPWHEGHFSCLKLCSEISDDQIIVVPDNSPWKKVSAPLSECRFVRYKTLCLKLKNSNFEVYPSFWGMEETNPTVNWLLHTRFIHKGLLIGDDTFMELHRWLNFNVLMAGLNKLMVVPRNHSNDEMMMRKKELERDFPHLQVEILPEHDFQEVSSTKRRE